MRQSLSNKLLLAVVAAVALPFAAFALFLDHEITNRLALQVSREMLRGLARDLADGVDMEIARRVEDLASWAREPLASWVLREAHFVRDGAAPPMDAAVLGDLSGGAGSFREVYEEVLAGYLERKERYDLVVLLDERGVPIATAARTAGGQRVRLVGELTADRPAEQPWFRAALSGSVGLIDHHRSAWLGEDDPGLSVERRRHHIGIAVGVPGPRGGAPMGVLVGLVNWSVFEALIDAPLVKDAFRGLVAHDVTPSPYAWIWASDGDTILAHQDRSLYYEKVSGPRIGLPRMVEDVRTERSGLHRPYTFVGVRKNAAFARTRAEPGAGFDWVVGVGIDNSDVERATQHVSSVLVRGTLAVLLVVVVWAVMIARRTVRPIKALEEHTRCVASGDLTARVHIDTDDELAELARAFNRMTADLAVQNEKLIKAEKDAAWREMARQIAHDLKNPLTPIQLSLDLVDRARAARDPRLPQIEAQSLDMIRRQVAHLREIATGFHEFTGGAKPRPEHFDLADLARELVDIHGDLARERGIAVEVELESCPVFADRAKIRRAATNLVSNGIESMEGGGRLVVRCRRVEGYGRFEVLDNGRGLSAEVQARLFEPYFTTKSAGTGLGLAIARRVVDEAGGRLALVPRPPAEGGGCRAELDLPLVTT